MLLHRNFVHKSPFKLFLLKLVFLFSIVFVLDFSIGKLLNYYYFKQERGSQYLTTFAAEQMKADFVIFGSSRANHHYRPDIFEKGLHLSFFNAGRDGNFLFYHYAILKAVLKRYTPKVVILDFIHGEFSKNQDSYDRISSLLPYYRRHPEMRSVIELKSPFEKVKMLSSIYPNNSNFLIIAGGNAFFSKKKRIDSKGYIPRFEIWNKPIENEKMTFKYELDATKIKIFELFIKDCVSSKVKLYIICSPYFVQSKFPDYSITVAETIAKKSGIPFWDYSRDSAFTGNAKLFADPAHLNDSGAKIFSLKVVDRIKSTEGFKIGE